MAFPALEDLPVLYRAYHWEGRYHQPNDFAPDNWVHGFPWIRHLEDEFADQENITLDQVLQVLRWGDNVRNIQRVQDLNAPEQLIASTTAAFAQGVAENWDAAIRALFAINRIGLTYASKLLRFRFPSHVGALDTRLRDALGGLLPRIYDGDDDWHRNSMVEGFAAFRELLTVVRNRLVDADIEFPGYPDIDGNQPWTLAGVEMALFSWASNGQRTLADCLNHRAPL
jgi:hypothetical protein